MSSSGAAATTMLPYRKQGEIDYASLEFNPDIKDTPPDHMEQSQELRELLGLIAARCTDFDRRPDVFLDDQTFICYDPGNLNVRVAPDIYLAFGVDAAAIRPRKIYLPWEVGKPPDLAIEIASESTAQRDLSRKPAIYAQIGIREFWRFDPTGGEYYGHGLAGYRLVDGAYREIPLAGEPDGILKGYSEVLEASICHDEGWPRLYDPATGTYDANWRQDRAGLEASRAAHVTTHTDLQVERIEHATTRAELRAVRAAKEAARAAKEAARTAEEAERAARQAAEAELARLREEIRRQESE